MSDGADPGKMRPVVTVLVLGLLLPGCAAPSPVSEPPQAESLPSAATEVPSTAPEAPSSDPVATHGPSEFVLDPDCVYDGGPLAGVDRVTAWLSDPPVGEDGEGVPTAREVVVPDLTGMDFEAAWPYLCTLAKSGMYFYAEPLDVTAEGTVPVPGERLGTVESQALAPGVTVPVGTRQLLGLQIAAPHTGDAEADAPAGSSNAVVVPDVSDLRPRDARELLELSGLVRGEIQDDPAEDADGRVLRTVPGAGELVEPGTVVNLVM